MIQLTDKMKSAVNSALADKVPCIVATASADGKPGIGYRGSVMNYGDDSLAYWERTFRQGSENIEGTPQTSRRGSSLARQRFIATTTHAKK